MKIRKLFSRVFKAGNNPTQGFIRNNPNDYSQHGRHPVAWHQGGPLTTPRSYDYRRGYDYRRSLDYIHDLELTYRMLY